MTDYRPTSGPADEHPVKVTMLRHDSGTGPTCPALYDTHRDTALWVGKRVSDPSVLAQLAMAADETVVEIPWSLLPEVARDARS